MSLLRPAIPLTLDNELIIQLCMRPKERVAGQQPHQWENERDTAKENLRCCAMGSLAYGMSPSVYNIYGPVGNCKSLLANALMRVVGDRANRFGYDLITDPNNATTNIDIWKSSTLAVCEADDRPINAALLQTLIKERKFNTRRVGYATHFVNNRCNALIFSNSRLVADENTRVYDLELEHVMTPDECRSHQVMVESPEFHQQFVAFCAMYRPAGVSHVNIE